MRTTRQIAAALEEFQARYSQVVGIALMTYSEHMRKNADEIQAGYDAIKDDPEARARQDQTYITTNGLLHSARAIREAADRADAARQAWEELAELTEDGD